MKSLLFSALGVAGLVCFAQNPIFYGQNHKRHSATRNGYSFARSITIDHTQVGSSDSSNFQIAVAGTYSYLATTAHSGNVQNSSGFDLVYTSDSGCSTLLKFERVSWSASTGAIQAWVKVPIVSHTSDSSIYECYGNSAITTDQQDVIGTWPAPHKAVYHMENVGSIGATVPDSTGNNNGAIAGGATLATDTGVIGNSIHSHQASAVSYIDLGAMSNLYNGSNTVATVSYWFSSEDVTNANEDVPIGEVSQGAGPAVYSTFGQGSNYLQFTYCVTSTCSSYRQLLPSSTTLSNTTWYYVVHTMDLGTPSNSNTYLNGTLQTRVQNTAGTPPTTWNALFSDASLFKYSTDWFQGWLDEVHFSTTTPSADWITAEYNNQKSGSTMLTISSPL